MESVLIISSTEQSTNFFIEMLSQDSYKEIVTTKNSGEARRLLKERNFDLCIVNGPLSDENGEKIAVAIASKGIGQVILLVKSNIYEEICEKVEAYGVFTIAKPTSKSIFWNVLKLANASYNKMIRLQDENTKLLQRIEDIRLIDRAKYTLIEYLKMTESEAHRYIEKQAMDMRTTKRIIAEGILKTYES